MNRFAAFIAYAVIIFCWLLPWVEFYWKEWLPRYRVQRRWDGKFMGRDGNLVQAVCPKVLDIRRRLWLLTYPVSDMYVQCHRGQVHLQTVVTALRWLQGMPLHTDKRMQRRLQRRN